MEKHRKIPVEFEVVDEGETSDAPGDQPGPHFGKMQYLGIVNDGAVRRHLISMTGETGSGESFKWGVQIPASDDPEVNKAQADIINAFIEIIED